MSEPLQIILVPHTHWDREWYQTFQQFRMRLVNTVDKLLDILEQDEAFRFFLLDGQTVILDDYLEVRPEQEERLRRQLQSGRLLTGPWYVQPDEFLVSGEALIRNLTIGLQRASEFTTPMRIGYTPDTFGHIAQLPQILQGSGIDSMVFWRGVGKETDRSEFYWEAPDGSRVLAIHLADPLGYANARQLPLHIDEFMQRVELLVANIFPYATTNALLFMNGFDHDEAQKGLPAILAQANKRLGQLEPGLQQFLNTTSRNGQKYNAISIEIGTLSHYIERIHQQDTLQTLRGELRSSQRAHLLPGVLSTRMWLKQQNAITEQLLERWVEPMAVWSHILGVPYPHGLIQLAWRYLLQNHAHDSICGCSIDQVHRENSVRFAQSQQIGEGVLAQALQEITKRIDTRAPFAVTHATQEPLAIIVFNPAPGPRTDIVTAEVELPGTLQQGEIVDEQGQLMPYSILQRWRQELGTMPIAREVFASAVMLAGASTPEQFLALAETTLVTALGQSEQTHAITHLHIDESDVAASGIATIEVMIAPRGRVMVNERELHATIVHVMALLEREDIITLECTAIDQARETIEFVASGLPAYGYKTFWLYPAGRQERPTSLAVSPLIVDQHSIENEYYRVEVSKQDGTLILTDKQTKAVFAGLNRIVDGGDIGDLYTYCPPPQDRIISEPVETPQVELINKGPVQATLRVSGRWALPGACTADRQERNARATICPIRSEITLIPGVRRVQIHTTVENKVKDHRLRVIFPVPYKVEEASAEGTFEVRTRPARQATLADSKEWAEAPVSTYPQKRFVDISNGETGLGILNQGLPEYEVLQSPETGLKGESSALALTLLRCVEWLSRSDLATRHGHAGPAEHTPEAQCLGHHEFDYALVTHPGRWDAEAALVLREAQAFTTPIATHAMVTEQRMGKQPTKASLITVTPEEIVVSAIMYANHTHNLVVRVYNPLEQQIHATIKIGVSFQQVSMANLQGKVQHPIAIEPSYKNEDMQPEAARPPETTVHITLPGGAIRTLVFETSSKWTAS